MNLRKVVTRDRLRRPPLRVQLTVLYAGLFVFLVAAVLGVSGLLVGRSVRAAPVPKISSLPFFPARFYVDSQHGGGRMTNDDWKGLLGLAFWPAWSSAPCWRHPGFRWSIPTKDCTPPSRKGWSKAAIGSCRGSGRTVPGQADPVLLGHRRLAESLRHVGSGRSPAGPAVRHVRHADYGRRGLAAARPADRPDRRAVLCHDDPAGRLDPTSGPRRGPGALGQPGPVVLLGSGLSRTEFIPFI